jgi:hypothetical protein
MSEVKGYITSEDIDIIEEAILLAAKNGEKVWDQEILGPIKSKIKGFSLCLLEDRCCYCCKNFYGEFNMVMDIEHILPKSKYGQFELSPFNLSLACKRCNMNIKGEDDSFLIDRLIAHQNPEDGSNYLFIHPNMDDYFEHLQYDVEVRNARKMIKYTVINDSLKGRYTYDYFELMNLEINSLNKAQGLITEEKKLSKLIPDEFLGQIELLLNELK